MIKNDNLQRELALAPTQSFIVQAPAGSGKTELLTQRFLNLLAHANNAPEEIIAITFTRKAAAEMHARIIKALRFAKSNPKPIEPFAATTWILAKNALFRDEALNWQLLYNPNRLCIYTIDALCSRLTQQMPILSRFGAQPKISDHLKSLYQKAVESLLESLDEETSWHDALCQLLSHCDNNITLVTNLLMNMLAKRDQWLPYITQAHSTIELRVSLENSLMGILEDQLELINNHFPHELADELHQLSQFAANNLISEEVHSPITLFFHLNDRVNEQAKWLGIAELLLTTKGELRKRVTKSIGFPAPSSTKNENDKTVLTEMKKRMEALLVAFEKSPGLISSLHELREVPPTTYTDIQWNTVSSLLSLLPLAAAQLTLVFRDTNEIDYIEMTQAALLALGSFDEPTDLALALDYKIQHLLVDEFQDTSLSQFRLLELLTAGWTNGDGRTLFVVGDPMQSIYRFRQAEVGLFLRAQHEGIGQIALTPIHLTSNFRSSKTIIDWVNHHCAVIFPLEENISEGAVTYSNATAIKTDHQSSVTLHSLIDAENIIEAINVAALIKQHQNRFPNESIAILVKARHHLLEILPTLRANNIAYSAVEIDELINRPVIQDLLALTRALLHPANRTAWLSVLRAPWCGLRLEDLLTIANNTIDETILDTIQNDSVINTLSTDGQKRLREFSAIISEALQERSRHPLRTWLYEIWLSLKAPAYLKQHSDLDDAALFFDLIDQCDLGGDIKEIASLEEMIAKLYAFPDHPANETLQIMTIHKAKGLEFDTVIIPGLQRGTRSKESQLLLWAERPRAHGENDLILAPIKSSQEIDDPIYQYLNNEHKRKDSLENLRLFYVAVTRARKHLHLIGTVSRSNDEDLIKNPPPESFLKTLWPMVNSNFILAAQSTEQPHFPEIKTLDNSIEGILRLPLANKTFTALKTPGKNEPIIVDDFINQSRLFTATGTLIHHLLQKISFDGLDQWPLTRLSKLTSYWEKSLLQLGVLPSELNDAIKLVKSAIQNTLNDQKGRWILLHHTEAKSEFALTLHEGKQIIIDRTFIDENGVRWIIDYKTTNEEIRNFETFSAEAKEKHQAQLENYACVLRQLNDQSIMLGLFYPIQSIWIEWESPPFP